MTFILDIFDGPEEGDYDTRSFKTRIGAINAGNRWSARKHGTNGHFAVNRHEGSDVYGRSIRHVIAEWRKDGRLLARVWH